MRFATCAVLAALVAPGITRASTDTHWIQIVYIVPADAPNRALAEQRSRLLLEGSRFAQAQWRSWGLSYRLEGPAIVYSDKPCTFFRVPLGEYPRSEEHIQDVRRAAGFPDLPNVRYVQFVECSTAGGAAGAMGNDTFYFDSVTTGVANEIAGNSPIARDTGAIGHELGHNFDLMHENCSGMEPANAADLVARGLPGDATKSIECNGGAAPGNWPYINPPEGWMRALITDGPGPYAGCDWLHECSGGNIPTVPFTKAPAHFRPEGKAFFQLQSMRSATCLEITVGELAPFAAVGNAACDNARAHQQFEMVVVPGDESFLLRARHSNRCLGVTGGDLTVQGLSSPRDGTPVQQMNCTAHRSQRYRWRGTNLVVEESGKCLAVAEGASPPGLQQTQCNDGDSQQWRMLTGDSDRDGLTDASDADDDNDGVADTGDAFPLDPTESADTDGDGIGDHADPLPRDPVNAPFSIRAKHSGLCLNVSVGGQATQEPCTRSAAQSFYRVGSEPSFEIRQQGTGLCLQWDNVEFSRRFELRTCGRTLNQLFTWRGAAIVEQQFGQCLDIEGASALAGARLIVWPCVDSAGNQRFAFDSRATPPRDTDGDGVPDERDSDDDADGVADAEDAFPLDPQEWLDTDGDRVGNNADADDDGDGVPDRDDAAPLESAIAGTTECDLVDDGGFEIGIGGWQGDARAQRIQGAYAGTFALQIRSGYLSLVRPVSGGTNLRLQGAYRRQGGAGWSGTGFDFVDSAGNEIGERLHAFEPVADWTAFELAARVPVDASHLRVWVYAGSDAVIDLDAIDLRIDGCEAPAVGNRVPVLTDPADRLDFLGQAVSVRIDASGPDGAPIRIEAEGLPAGLGIDPVSGVISGTPTRTELTYVTLRASDGRNYRQGGFSWAIVDRSGTSTCNLITNGGFEQGNTGWRSSGTSRLVGDASSGTSALQLSGGWASTKVSASGVQYLLSGFHRSAVASGWSGVGVDFLDAGDNEIGKVLRPLAPADGYVPFTLPVAPPTGTSSLRVWFYGDAQRALMIDAIELRNHGCSASSPSGAGTPSSLGDRRTRP